MSDPFEMTSEAAKAAGEVAKAGGKVVDAGRAAGGWLDRIFGQGVEDLVARRWSDRQRALRIEAAIYDWERLVRLLEKVASRLSQECVDKTRAVPPKIVLPLLEHATMEEDEELHSRWANLLSSALNPSVDSIERKFVSTLAELTAADAEVFENICLEWKIVDKNKFQHVSTLKYGPGVDADANEISIITLARLGLITPSSIDFKTYSPPGHNDRYGDFGPTEDEVRVYGNLDVVTITAFGEAFYRAVSDAHGAGI